MAKVIQEEIDRVIPKMNQAIDLNKRLNPGLRLKKIPKGNGAVVLMAPKEISAEYGRALVGSAAFFDFRSNRIIIGSEGVEREMSLIEGNGNDGVSGPWVNGVRLSLLNILMHENVHRSTKTVVEPKRVRDLYLECAKALTEHSSNRQVYEEIEEVGGRMHTKGVRIHFEHSEGGASGKVDMDEFMVDWIAAEALSAYLTEVGIYRNRVSAVIATLLPRLPLYFKGSVDFPLELVKGFGRKEEFLRDYLAGRIPKKIGERLYQGREVVAAKAVTGLLTGEVILLPDVVGSAYGHKKAR